MKTKEELKYSYLEYSPDVTNEIFDEIILKLKDLGFIEFSTNNGYANFSKDGDSKLILSPYFEYYVSDGDMYDRTRLKVSDILGEETKFEVGKWYSFYWNWSSGYNCIGKVCQVGNHVRTAIHFNNYTSNNSPGALFTDERVIYLAEIENIKELSLEEIQQYLPDNHPDRIAKPIEKWSVGSYVVFLQKYGCSNKGTIDVIKEFDYNSIVGYLEKEGISPGYLDRELNNYLKWFATLSEAEAFSKSLLEPEREDLNKYDSEGNLIKMKKYVKCDTQEQWDFVKTKCNQDTCSSLFHKNRYIDLTLPGNSYYNHELMEPYKLYTFQEWLDLNGYTFEEGMSNKFNIGDEVKVCSKSEDLKGHGFLDSLRDKVSPINGAAGSTGIIESLKEYAGTIYYELDRFAPNGYISEDCLKLVKSCVMLKEAKKLTEEFKVGDYVISLIDTFYGREKGDLLLITGEDSYIIIATNKTELFSDTIASDEVVKSLRKATAAEIMAVTKPKEKPFEYNKWYKYKEKPEYLAFMVSETIGYGFNADGEWFNTTSGSWYAPSTNYIPATDSEVKEALLNYARGHYPAGTKFKELLSPYSLGDFNDNKFNYYPDNDQLTCGQSIYIKGKWAEVISKPKSIINRNVYYEVETQEQYNEILDWLESKGEFLHPNSRKLEVINNWKYVVFNLSIPNSWALRGGIPNLSKAEFQFKGKLEKQPIKTGMGLREQMLQNQYQYEYKTIDSSSVWETLMNPSTQNSTINLKQEPIKLLSFEEDDVVLFKTNSVKISNKQLIIND